MEVGLLLEELIGLEKEQWQKNAEREETLKKIILKEVEDRKKEEENLYSMIDKEREERVKERKEYLKEINELKQLVDVLKMQNIFPPEVLFHPPFWPLQFPEPAECSGSNVAEKNVFRPKEEMSLVEESQQKEEGSCAENNHQKEGAKAEKIVLVPKEEMEEKSKQKEEMSFAVKIDDQKEETKPEKVVTEAKEANLVEGKSQQKEEAERPSQKKEINQKKLEHSERDLRLSKRFSKRDDVVRNKEKDDVVSVVKKENENMKEKSDNAVSLTWSPIHCSAVSLSQMNLTVVNRNTCGLLRLAFIGEGRFSSGIVVVKIRINTMSMSSGCVLGVMPYMPYNLQSAFGYHTFTPGYGLHADCDKKGLYHNGKLIANSTHGFGEGDLVEMRMNIRKGWLEYAVNGAVCVSVCSDTVKEGGYVGCAIREEAAWTIITAVHWKC